MSVSIAFDEVFVQDDEFVHCLKEGNSVHYGTHLKHEKTQNQQVKLDEFGVQMANNYTDTSRKGEHLKASVQLGGWGCCCSFSPLSHASVHTLGLIWIPCSIHSVRGKA